MNDVSDVRNCVTLYILKVTIFVRHLSEIVQITSLIM